MNRSRAPNIVLFAGGFVTFSLLYSVQPLLPAFAREFGVNPATSSLALSVTTGALAFSMLGAAGFADRTGRRPVMIVSLLASSLTGLAVPLCHHFAALLTVRFLLGVLLAGLPAVAMAYLAEEIPAARIGSAMGVYIAGNAVGGMSGRLTIGLLTDLLSWRWGLALQAGICLAVSIWFAIYLPPSQNFRAVRVDLKSVRRNVRSALGNPVLWPLFGIAFLLMGSFGSLYNYMAFLLMKAPYNLSHSAVGWIFLLYLVGTVGSASMGRQADEMGRTRVLSLGLGYQAVGALITLAPALTIKIAGLALFTYGFFGSHSTASGWVGARSGELKATAATLYLLFYYCGASLGGWAGGYFWIHLGWGGVVLMGTLFLAAALVLGRRAGSAEAALLLSPRSSG